MRFLSSVKFDTGLRFVPLNKTGMPLINTLVMCNIEESRCIPYPFNYGEDNFLSFTMDRRTQLMDPSPHTPILLQNNSICIELS